MTRQFCDRCGAEITGVQSGSVIGIDDADNEGNGQVTDSADVCRTCYAAFRAWLKMRVPNARQRK